MKHLDQPPAIAGNDAESVAGIVRDCAACGTMALVLDLETEWLSRAEFAACSRGSVALDVFNVTPDCFPAASLVMVAFVWGEQARAFLAPVVRIDGKWGRSPFSISDAPGTIGSCRPENR